MAIDLDKSPSLYLENSGKEAKREFTQKDSSAYHVKK